MGMRCRPVGARWLGVSWMCRCQVARRVVDVSLSFEDQTTSQRLIALMFEHMTADPHTRTQLIIGRGLTARARESLGLEPSTLFRFAHTHTHALETLP